MLKAHQVIKNPITGEQLEVVKTPEETGGKGVEIDFIVAPHKGETAAHCQDTDESWTVIEGEAAYQLNGQVHPLKTGETVVIPKGSPHKNPWNTGDGVLRLHRVIRIDTPDLDTMRNQIRFFETNYALAQQGKVRSDGLPKDPLQTVVMLDNYIPTLYLAGIPLPVQRVVFRILAIAGRARGYKPYYEITA